MTGSFPRSRTSSIELNAHVSKETNAWIAAQHVGRFELTFTPKHGSWLNLIEGSLTRLPKSSIANGDDFQLPREFIEVLFHPI